jgi:hypothetical protein
LCRQKSGNPASGANVPLYMRRAAGNAASEDSLESRAAVQRPDDPLPAYPGLRGRFSQDLSGSSLFPSPQEPILQNSHFGRKTFRIQLPLKIYVLKNFMNFMYCTKILDVEEFQSRIRYYKRTFTF